MDIYLLDQLLKGRIHNNQLILDAGCGWGRNLVPLLKQGYNIFGIDPKSDCISELKNTFPKEKDHFKCTSIEKNEGHAYDFIICNAVLHFAKDHHHFDQMILSLVNQLKKDGILFIRMTSNIGLNRSIPIHSNGLCDLPDGSTRYLLTREKINKIIGSSNMILLEPIKTVNVDELRFMTTLIFQNSP